MQSRRISRRLFLALPGALAATAALKPALGASSVCQPSSVTVANTTAATVTLSVCTQGSCLSLPGQPTIGGAPFGVDVSYITNADYLANNYTVVNGSFSGGNAVEQHFGPIPAGACANLLIGNQSPLHCGTTYVFRILLSGGVLDGVTYGYAGPWGVTATTQNCTAPPPPPACTCGQGYWKTHPSAWPAAVLVVGKTTYTKDQLLTIFEEPVRGNGLVSLVHQLIAAKLNILSGATCTTATDAIRQADNLIGPLLVPPVGSGVLPLSTTSVLTQVLEDFNEGRLPGCPGGCN